MLPVSPYAALEYMAFPVALASGKAGRHTNRGPGNPPKAEGKSSGDASIRYIDRPRQSAPSREK